MGGSSSKKTYPKKEEILNDNHNPKKDEIIEEKNVNNHPHISEKFSEKFYNSIVNINFSLNKEEFFGTGFFIKLNLDNKNIPFIICHHIIKEEFVNKKININIKYGKFDEEINLEIKLDRNERFIKCFDRPINVTLIEIKQKDKISEDKYLFPDLNYKNGYNQYKKIIIFAGGYPNDDINKGKNQCYSPGKIIEIKDKIGNFLHNCATKEGSSGSPLINLDFQVVGIHYGCNDRNTINYGSFIGIIVDKLYLEENKINFKSKEINEIKIYKKDDKEDENIYNIDNKNINEKEIEKVDNKEEKILK